MDYELVLCNGTVLVGDEGETRARSIGIIGGRVAGQSLRRRSHRCPHYRSGGSHCGPGLP